VTMPSLTTRSRSSGESRSSSSAVQIRSSVIDATVPLSCDDRMGSFDLCGRRWWREDASPGNRRAREPAPQRPDPAIGNAPTRARIGCAPGSAHPTPDGRAHFLAHAQDDRRMPGRPGCIVGEWDDLLILVQSSSCSTLRKIRPQPGW
jgi:hypothetical protein